MSAKKIYSYFGKFAPRETSDDVSTALVAYTAHMHDIIIFPDLFFSELRIIYLLNVSVLRDSMHILDFSSSFNTFGFK